MFSQQQQIDRLATTSRLLYDVRLISQRQEIEKLKLDIFWRDHSLYRFNCVILEANRTQVKCKCALCKLKRDDCDYFNYDDYDIDETACKFMPWLYKKMDECGFLVEKGFGIFDNYENERLGPLNKKIHCEDRLCHFFNTTIPDMRGRPPVCGRLPEMVINRYDYDRDNLDPEEAAECDGRPQRDFGLFRFGLLLTGAKTVDDPCLKKYAAFLRMLEGVQEEDEDDDDA